MAKTKRATTAEPHRPKTKITVMLRPDTLERARRAAYWEPGVTISGLVDELLTDWLDRAEKRRGEPYKPIPEGRMLRHGWRR